MELFSLQKKIGYDFHSTALLARALTHSSYANETGCEDNERLEFLGDAVIGLIVSGYLFDRFPGRAEGELSVIKSVVVSGETLAKAARKLNLGDYLLLGRGENRSGGRERTSILAGAFESVAAAVYLDGGISAASRLVVSHLSSEADEVERDGCRGRHKGMLQEIARTEYGLVPEYSLLGAAGQGGGMTFSVNVSVGGRVLGSGSGSSKKEAEAEAARRALCSLGEELS